MTDQRRTIMAVNGQGASAPDAHTERVVRRALKMAEAYDVDLIAWCEVAEVWVPALSEDAHNMSSYQFGEPWADDAISGLAISWNDATGSTRGIHTTKGSDKTSEGSWKTGAGIRERPVLHANYDAGEWKSKVHVMHPPPLRAPRSRRSYITKALRFPGILIGDSNYRKSALLTMRGRRDRRVVSSGLMAIFVPRRFAVTNKVTVDVGSDHDALIITIEPKAARNRRLRGRKKR